jgi:hypothetical protein
VEGIRLKAEEKASHLSTAKLYLILTLIIS